MNGRIFGAGFGYSEAHRHRHRNAVRDRSERPHLGADALGEAVGRLQAGLRQDHCQLLAAGPSHQVVLAGVLAQGIGHRDQHDVAGRVPEAVVHQLEVVKVERQHGEWPMVATRSRQILLSQLQQAPPAQQPGEPIRGGDGVQVVPGSFELDAAEELLST